MMVGLLLLIILHPFHVSVTEVDYNKDSQSLQFSCRIFLDDLEEALQAETGDVSLDIVRDSAKVYKASKLYFSKRFVVRVDGRRVSVRFLGGEVEEDAMWCYLEVEKVTRFTQVELENTVLFEVFDDQQNMIHFRLGEETRSYVLTERNPLATYPKE